MEIFPAPEITYDSVARGFGIEAFGLASLAEAPRFPEFVRRFADYPRFLEERKKDRGYQKAVEKLAAPNGELDTGMSSPVLQDVFLTAHLAACCDLFAGGVIPVGALNRDMIAPWMESKFRVYENESREALHQLDSRLHSMDAVRTMQILRVLGLITRTTEEVHQLSLGAGPATKDVRSIHLVPHASIEAANALDRAQAAGALRLGMTEKHPADIVITDADPQRKEQYDMLNRQTAAPRILAYNEDTLETLRRLPTDLKAAGMAPRNLVVALRIDHRMIVDTRRFLSLLAGSIDGNADLVVTIGSGFTLDDYIGRTRKIEEIRSTLKRCGLEPLLIKLHGKGGHEQQRNTPSFGLSGITTYEILYCKLKQKKLASL